jgi:glycosyltransferase involved in cell wall biosynthesis
MHVLIAAATDYGSDLFGGIASYILDVTQELEYTDTVTLLGIAGAGRRCTSNGAAGVLLFPGGPSSIPRRAALASSILLRRGPVRRIAPDVLYAHSPEIGLALSVANPQIPLVMHMHGTEPNLRSSRFSIGRSTLAVASFDALIQRPTFARAASIIVTADTVRYAALLSAMPLEGRAKYVRIPSMVNLKRYRRALPAREVDGKPLKLIAIGRLVPRKGVDSVLRAVQALRSRGTHAVIRVVGDGPERDKLERLASTLGVRGAVEFTGYVPRDRVAAELCDADIYVSGSVQEGFSMALLESLASGVPVVGFDVGGISDVVVAGSTGALALDKTPEALADAIERLVPVTDRVRQECVRVAEAYSSGTVAGHVRQVLARAAGANTGELCLSGMGTR